MMVEDLNGSHDPLLHISMLLSELVPITLPQIKKSAVLQKVYGGEVRVVSSSIRVYL